MAASASSSEERELALIEKVEFRIALADDDIKLQSLLATYLAPLLLKLGSDYVNVRNRVVSICQHVKARTKPQNIQLPCAALVRQFQDHQDSRLIRHFDLVFLQQGFSRLSHPERVKLLPVFTAGISKLSSVPTSEASVIFYLFLQTLSDFDFPPKDSTEDRNLRGHLGLSKDDASYLSHWTGKLFQFRTASSDANSVSLTRDEQEFLTVAGKDGAWNAASLANAKYACTKLLSSRTFEDSERLIPTLLASADQNSRISSLAEETLKRVLPEIDINESLMIRSLLDLYFGSAIHATASSPAALRIRILGILSKASSCTSFTTEIKYIATQDLLSNASSYGREALKLRSAIVQFLIMIAREASQPELAAISEDVLNSLKEFLDQQYADRSSSEQADLRGRCFVLMGLLASASAQALLEPELKILKWLFNCLAEERDKQVAFSISEALSSCLSPLQKTEQANVTDSLRDLLFELSDTPAEYLNSGAVMHCVLRFANRCLPADDVYARWVNLAILASIRHQSFEILEEAQKGLDPYWLKLGQDVPSRTVLPDFPTMASFVFEQRADSLSNMKLSIIVVRFLRQCLLCWSLAQAGRKFEFTIDWQSKLDVAVRQDYGIRTSIYKGLQIYAENREWDLVMRPFSLCCHVAVSEVQYLRDCARIISEIAFVAPADLLKRIASSFAALRSGILANDTDARTEAAQAFGLLASHSANSDEALSQPTDQLFEVARNHQSATGASLNRVHGSIIALAHLIGRRHYYDQQSGLAKDFSIELLQIIFTILAKSANAQLVEAALQGLSQLCMFSAVDCSEIERFERFENLMPKLTKFAKDGNGFAVHAIGHLTIILDEVSQQDLLVQAQNALHELHEIRQPETQLAVGEALTVSACGWDSAAMEAYLPMTASKPKRRSRRRTLEQLLERVLKDCRTTKPTLKKASVIWLLCFIQFCGNQVEVQTRLKDFQTAFKRCLADRDELVQESASRGLGLVYEKGSRELKDDLVRDLVSTFSSNKAEMSGTVNDDTQLFEPGTLPTGEGSVSTYKDVMSLASEVGDPSLVYR
ncbi:MAG: hypothetical protein Q9162_002243 [Coniocarpon cinnabarinum]